MELTIGRSCSLRNSGRLFLRRSLRKSRRVRMTAVMTKADTRPARRGFVVGVWCCTVAGTQTHPRDHLTSRSLKPGSFGFDKWQNFSSTSRLKVQQEPNTTPAAACRAFSEQLHLRHLQAELACLAEGFRVWMLLGKTIL